MIFGLMDSRRHTASSSWLAAVSWRLTEVVKHNLLLILLCLSSVLVARASGQTQQILDSFWTQGRTPSSKLLEASDGYLYGTTFLGGSYGTIFRMPLTGLASNLFTFQLTNGHGPRAALVQTSDGSMFSTTEGGGSMGFGTIFRFSPGQGFSSLHSFNGTNGRLPSAGLVVGPDRLLYGTTYYGGQVDQGTLFRISTNGAFTNLLSFFGSNGALPRAELILGSDNQLYGTTEGGGAFGKGTVFKVSTNGVLTTLTSFSGTPQGAAPVEPLLLASDGLFYGTTSEGGTNNAGTVFGMNGTGNVTLLTHLPARQFGGGPEPAGLLERDGIFYGTTRIGGSGGHGTIFSMDRDGALTTVLTFTNGNGGWPNELVEARDGNLYGTTRNGTNAFTAGVAYRFMVPVRLNAGRSGTNVVLSWLTNASGYSLEFTNRLGTNMVWSNAGAAVVKGRYFTVTNPATGGGRFYRLRKP